MSRYLRSRQDSVVNGGMPVRHQHDGVAERHGATSSCINAELALKAANDQLGDTPRHKKLVQPRNVKGVRSCLPQEHIAAVNLKRWREGPAIGSVVHVTILRLVLDDNYEGSGSACLAGNQVDAIDYAIDIVRNVLA